MGGSKDDQFAPFRGGVVGFIVSVILTGKHTVRHFSGNEIAADKPKANCYLIIVMI